MTVSLSVEPKGLANILANAVAISKEAKTVRTLEHVLLAYQPGKPAGSLIAYGVSPHAAGRTVMKLDETGQGGASAVCLSRDNANALQSALRKVKGGKAARVGVSIYDEPTLVHVKNENGLPTQQQVNLVVTSGDEVMLTLLDSDPQQTGDRYFDWVDDMLADPPGPPTAPVTFATETLTKLKDIYSDGTVVDIGTSKHERIYRIAIGSAFRGLLADVGREIYAEGGPWGNGSGRPEHLL